MKQHHPRPDIHRLLKRRALHGLTFREISEESGIPIPTLSYWASRQHWYEDEDESLTEFVPIEIENEDPPGTIAIELGPSVRVTVERGFDEEHLTRVLAVLARC
jgi:hypothetical protein